MTRTAVPLCLLAALAGCSSSGSGTAGGGGPTKAAVVHEVGGMISLYSGETGRGPRKAADLAKYENGYPLGYRAVASGDVVVIWGATVAGEGGGGTEDVVAYEKKAPTEGGAVLLANGKVKEMTAAEFQSAPKAAGKK